jgi:predicted RND superfamily exporter protein
VASALHVKINFFNFVVYPITFGIAVDYGANVLARMRARRTILPALSEVGPAVALCNWTSIVGYGSLLFSLNRALRSFGWYAMAGEVTTILTALLLLPALLLSFPNAMGGRVPRMRPGHDDSADRRSSPGTPGLGESVASAGGRGDGRSNAS